jgi:hypothetical protein
MKQNKFIEYRGTVAKFGHFFKNLNVFKGHLRLPKQMRYQAAPLPENLSKPLILKVNLGSGTTCFGGAICALIRTQMQQKAGGSSGKIWTSS